ncbi:MAG: TRZ/ATZ family hydrolase, partial [Methylococcaceae bacterium]|nr:TRZ/ATZ family hydrolase [Methylococcaceae bacterium]
MQVDLLIEAGWIIPVEPASVILEKHSLVVDQGRIVDLLDTEQARQLYQARQVEQRPHHVLIPGLVNCHSHAAMSLLAGFADDLPLMDW